MGKYVPFYDPTQRANIFSYTMQYTYIAPLYSVLKIHCMISSICTLFLQLTLISCISVLPVVVVGALLGPNHTRNDYLTEEEKDIEIRAK